MYVKSYERKVYNMLDREKSVFGLAERQSPGGFVPVWDNCLWVSATAIISCQPRLQRYFK